MIEYASPVFWPRGGPTSMSSFEDRFDDRVLESSVLV